MAFYAGSKDVLSQRSNTYCNFIELQFSSLILNCYDLTLQLASVILKQYVEAHWTCNAEKFRPPETTDAVSALNKS